MAGPYQQRDIDETFERLEETILPTISMMLDALMEAAEKGQPGIDVEIYAAELRTVALQLEALTKQVEALSPAHVDPKGYRLPSAV
jgi:hypothetical protein